MRLQFLGAAGQVTGSKYLLEIGGLRLLIDAGLFQERPYQSRNWDAPPFDPVHGIDAMLLTHAHLDHCGLLPRLVKLGFNRPVYTHAASAELTRLVMTDSARIQEEDVWFKKTRHGQEGRKSPHPYEPLYGQGDAQRAGELFRRVAYRQPLELNDHVTATFFDAAHVLGSAMIRLEESLPGQPTRSILFSGDLGGWDKPILHDPTLIPQADIVLMESTYGDRAHDDSLAVEDQLAQVINDTVARGGSVIIPTFAIERSQELMYHLSSLRKSSRIRNLMVFLDSPMAVDATGIFKHHPDCFDRQTLARIESNDSPLSFPGLVLCRSSEQSKAINQLTGSCIVLAGSGMCTGGRIKHHLLRHLPRETSTVLFVGYQSPGTLGREILDGAREVRLFGRTVPVYCDVRQIHGLSAHADQPALLRWLGGFAQPPQHLFLVHGEKTAAQTLAGVIQTRLGWSNVTIPDYRQTIDLS